MLDEKTKFFARSLIAWELENGRDFPWRKTKDPYKILIAEIMLQRTKADQVLPVYRSFIASYPDPLSLSKTPMRYIRRDIKSLGLEKRANGLKTLAKQLVDNFRGDVPDRKDSLLKLYGIGEYIANAILCHAYGKDVPTVDANFARVLQRVFSFQAKRPAQKDRRIWLAAERTMLFAEGQARQLNLAIIDLASIICVPRKPRCPVCPLRTHCDYAQRIT